MFTHKIFKHQMVKQVFGAAAGMLIALVAYTVFDAASGALRAMVGSSRQYMDTSAQWTEEDRTKNIMETAEHARQIMQRLEENNPAE